jgi:hypothetical protein
MSAVAPTPSRPFAAVAGRFSEEQTAWAGLAAAMVVSAAVLLWAGRHTTLYTDEFTFYQYFHDLDLRDLLTPHNAHLILVPRFIYAAVFQTVGPDHAVLAAVNLVGLLVSGGLFFVLAKRRVPPLVALGLTLPLLFFGSSWDVVLSTLGIQAVYSVAAGLGMLLALERRDPLGDLAACLLLFVSVACFTLGLAFLIGAAVAVLTSANRGRRAWIFLLPLLAYAIWWIWAHQFHQASIQQPSNVLLIPNFIADSFAAVIGSVAGLNYPIGSNLISSSIDIGWGRVLGLIAVAAFWWRLRRGGSAWLLRRGNTALSPWVILILPLAFWALIAIEASPTRTPEQTRYLYPGAVLLLLVVAETLRGVRVSRLGLLALFGAVAVSLGANLKTLDDASNHLRDFSSHARSDLAMINLSRDHVDPNLQVSSATRDLQDPVSFPVFAGAYLAADRAVGSPAFSPQEVLQQDEQVREDADITLAHALNLALEPSQPPPSLQECQHEPPTAPGGLSYFSLPGGGALLDLSGVSAATIQLRRFADSYSVSLAVPPGSKWVSLRIPSDSAPQPWWAVASSATPVTICPLP